MDDVRRSHNGARGKTGPVLECDTCRRPFGSQGDSMPRVLPCTHTYCHMCLSSLGKSGPRVALPHCDGAEVQAITCPKGCGDTPVGAAGATALPPNNVLIARLGRYGDLREMACCDECDGQVPADIWCDNCDAYFCKVHFSAMHQSRVGRRHRVAKATERPIHKQARCALHAGQDIVLYCRTCATAVCRDCCSAPFHGNHAECDVVPIEVAADDAAGTIRDAIKDLRGQLLSNLRDAASAVQVQLATLDTISHSRSADIDKAFKFAETSVVSALRERRAELQEAWKESSAHSRQSLSSQAEEIGAAAVGLTTACGETEMELRGNSAAALRRAPQLHSRLGSAKEQAELCRLAPMVMVPAAAAVPTNELASSVCQIIQSYGPMPGN